MTIVGGLPWPLLVVAVDDFAARMRGRRTLTRIAGVERRCERQTCISTREYPKAKGSSRKDGGDECG